MKPLRTRKKSVPRLPMMRTPPNGAVPVLVRTISWMWYSTTESDARPRKASRVWRRFTPVSQYRLAAPACSFSRSRSLVWRHLHGRGTNPLDMPSAKNTDDAALAPASIPRRSTRCRRRGRRWWRCDGTACGVAVQALDPVADSQVRRTQSRCRDGSLWIGMTAWMWQRHERPDCQHLQRVRQITLSHSAELGTRARTTSRLPALPGAWVSLTLCRRALRHGHTTRQPNGQAPWRPVEP